MSLKTTLLIVCLLFWATLSAQITKKNWLMGGTVDYRTTKHVVGSVPTNESRVFILSGRTGYFLFDRVAAGIIPLYRSGKFEASGGPTYDKSLQIGPFARYYFLPSDNKINLLLEAYYTRGSYSTVSGGSKSKDKSNTLVVQGGPVYFVNSVVGFELLLGYSSTKYSGESVTLKQTYISLGLQVHLEKDSDSPN